MQNGVDITKTSETIKTWVEQYSDNLFSWALHKTSSKETAEDIVQETFLAAVKSFDKFEGKSTPKTWLFSILNNKINDYYRDRIRKPSISDNGFFETFFDNVDHWYEKETPQSWNEETGHLLDNADFQKILKDCMKKLPENGLSAIQLKYQDEKKSELICQELNITITNYWQLLHRAKLQLRKCLDFNWFKK